MQQHRRSQQSQYWQVGLHALQDEAIDSDVEGMAENWLKYLIVWIPDF
jgi:hypothetical protein